MKTESFKSFMQTAKRLQVKGIINIDEISEETPPSSPQSLLDKGTEEDAVETVLKVTPRINAEMDISKIEEHKKVDLKMEIEAETKATEKSRKRKADKLGKLPE